MVAAAKAAVVKAAAAAKQAEFSRILAEDAQYRASGLVFQVLQSGLFVKKAKEKAAQATAHLIAARRFVENLPVVLPVPVVVDGFIK